MKKFFITFFTILTLSIYSNLSYASESKKMLDEFDEIIRVYEKYVSKKHLCDPDAINIITEVSLKLIPLVGKLSGVQDKFTPADLALFHKIYARYTISMTKFMQMSTKKLSC